MKRIPHNSASFKQHFSSEYNKLYDSCDIVISTPTLFSWSSSFSSFTGGITLSQKLPLRTYVGIKLNSTGIFKYVDYRSYSSVKGEFYDFPLDGLKLGDINGLFDTVLKTYPDLGSRNNFGGDLYVLTEQDWIELDQVQLCTSFLFLLSTNIISKKFFETMKGGVVHELIRRDEVQSIFKLLWKMLSTLSNPSNFPIFEAEIIGILFDSRFPLIYFTERQTEIFDTMREMHANHTGDEFIEGTSVWVARLEDLFPDMHFEQFFDFGLVYPGRRVPCSMEMMEHIFNNEQDWTVHRSSQELYATMKDALALESEPKETILTPRDKKNYALYHRIELLHYLALQLVGNYFHGIRFGSSKEFFHYLKQYTYLVQDLIVHRLDKKYNGWKKQIADILNSLISGNKVLQPKGFAGGARMLFCIEYGALIDRTEEFYLAIEESGMHVEYMSWIDGIEEKGMILEKYSPWEYTAESYNQMITNGHVEYVFRPNALGEYPVVVDVVHKKIFINGKKITSSDIPSQRYTVEFLYALFKAKKRYVHTAELPRSSYGKRKSEFVAKITTPLTKILEKLLRARVEFDVEEEGEGLKITYVPHDPVEIWFVVKRGDGNT